MCKIMEELKQEGFAEGEAKGFAQGQATAMLDIATNMKRLGKYSDEAIVLVTKLSLEQVKAIRV